ncbi:MAG TPA: 3-hydroxyacyl-ACP dehydratase FabZ [Acidimicrobiales bacterium]|jgi:3-hydroxyacyl-[acyl-carrier-protein] dehydratase|nr:3-hydroxyacyl-ACP dehydratase FabZ [Acidimicrobiales bacterium]
MSELSLDPAHWLPHRSPFLLLDTMLTIEPGVRASAQWTLRGDEWFFPGHFPGRPTTPGVLLLESIAQCGAVVVLSDERYAGRLPLFGGVERARFRRQIVPGDTVLVECEMTKLSARGGKGFGRATLDGDLAASAEIFFVLADAT